MSQINRGRTEPCKDTLSGVKNVYLWRWVKPSYLDVEVNDGVELISYPSTLVYKFETVADGNTYDENLAEDNAYDQSLKVVLKSVNAESNTEVKKLQKSLLGCVIEDYNGLFRLMGLRNGCDLDSINLVVGSNKADFNGYQLDITAQEEFKSPLFSDFNEVGFQLDSGNSYLLDEVLNILTDENSNRLIYA